ncbi:glycosyltransferase family 4 protein [Streptomyces sp. TverLS-915]|uniref:glycosyltransferase family 4 protein n=1 Tax=Streptomyces sp. TverLS-915 TaxID=1839763 RepID=UPI000B86E78D|nr:glycosyltransferase family 4 protein [Streptomyces sp. TverLS-915]
MSAEQCELPPRTRVLHLAQPVEGGVARVVTDLVRAQCADGLDVHLACPPGGTLGEQAARHGAFVHEWYAGRAPGPALRAETAGLRRVIDTVRPDLLHLHSAKAGLAARLAVRGALPTVFQPHAWSFEAAGGPVGAFARHWERYGARWADRLLCVSEAERRTGEQAGVRGEFVVLPNGVDLTAFRPEGGRYAYGDGAPLVVCVGRLCRQKGQDVLLRAWPAVREAVPGARLVLVGEGPDEPALRQQAGAGVEFAGAARDCARWYRAADLVVLPSRWEGMALAPLEAMACGRALVLTDTGGARESLPRAALPYSLVPPEAPGALTAALSHLLRTPALRAELAAAGLAHVRAQHDVRRTARAVSALYGGLLVRTPRTTPPGPRGTAAGARPPRESMTS